MNRYVHSSLEEHSQTYQFHPPLLREYIQAYQFPLRTVAFVLAEIGQYAAASEQKLRAAHRRSGHQLQFLVNQAMKQIPRSVCGGPQKSSPAQLEKALPGIPLPAA